MTKCQRRLTLSRAISVPSHIEFENVNADWLEMAARFAPTRPGAEFLNVCQHRFREKSAVQAAGFPVTPFQPVSCAQDIIDAGHVFGWPVIVKTCRSGYDGKGQVVVSTAAQAAEAFKSLQTDEAIAEKRIDFVAEVSMLGARSPSGEIVTYPLLRIRTLTISWISRAARSVPH